MNQDEAVATLIKYRIEQANKAIEDAQCLEAGNGSPRSIINRAYYAMFYAVPALLLREGSCPAPERRQHQRHHTAGNADSLMPDTPGRQCPQRHRGRVL